MAGFDAGNGKYFMQKGYIGGPHNAKEWIYYTSDAVTTVDGAGYIDDAEVIDKLDVGDMIWVYQVTDRDDLSKGIVDISVHVVLVNTGSVVNLSDDILGATVTYGD